MVKTPSKPDTLEDYARRIQEELLDVLLSKHNDYGPLNIANAPGGALNGLRVRMHDKLARINNIIDKGDTPNHESLTDSFIDLANYAIIAILVQRGQWEGTTVKGTNGSKNTKESDYTFRSPSTIPGYKGYQTYHEPNQGREA